MSVTPTRTGEAGAAKPPATAVPPAAGPADALPPRHEVETQSLGSLPPPAMPAPARPNTPLAGEREVPGGIAGGDRSTTLVMAETLTGQECVSANTNASLLISGLAGVALTMLFYVVLVWPLHTTSIGQMFWWDRGFVPFTTMLLSFWSLAILFIKSRKIADQRRALALDLLPLLIDEEINPDNVALFREHLRGLRTTWDNSYLVARVQRGLALFGPRRTVQDVASLLASQAEIDATAVQSSYRMVKAFIWSIPLLGFIGTVMGIGKAVGHFSGALQGAQELEVIKDSLQHVTLGLATAFDCTLIGLVMSIFIMIPMSSLQKSEEDFLTSVDEFCNDVFLRRLNEGRWSPGGDSGFQDASAGLPHDLRELQQQMLAETRDQAQQLQVVLQQVAESLQTTQQRAEHLPDTLAQQLTVAMTDIRGELAKVGAEAGSLFREQAPALQQIQQTITASTAQFVAHLETVRTVQAQTVTDMREALNEHRQRAEEVGRKVHLAANVAVERLDTASKSSATFVSSIGRQQQQLTDHFRALTDLLQQEQVLTQTQKLLAENLQMLRTSNQFDATLAQVSQALQQLTPVLGNLTQQVDRLATEQASGERTTGIRRWFGLK